MFIYLHFYFLWVYLRYVRETIEYVTYFYFIITCALNMVNETCKWEELVW